MDKSQAFWDAFRERWRSKLVSWDTFAAGKPGTGANFTNFLMERLYTMKECFEVREPGDFCFIFGPENTKQDPKQRWLAYSLEPNLTLRELLSARPLIPQLVIKG